MTLKLFFFSSSEQNSISGPSTAEFVTPSAVDIAVNTRATSSSINTYETVSSPGPPHSSGTSIPQQPISPSFLIASAGNCSVFSISLTDARTSASMNWRTVSRISFWWSLSEKSIVSVYAIRSLDRRHAWGYTGNRGGYHEDRSNRRQWTHRIKARHQASWAGTRGNRGVTPIGCQHSHRRRTGRSAGGRVGGR